MRYDAQYHRNVRELHCDACHKAVYTYVVAVAAQSGEDAVR